MPARKKKRVAKKRAVRAQSTLIGSPSDSVIDSEITRVANLYRNVVTSRAPHRSVLLNALAMEASALQVMRGHF